MGGTRATGTTGETARSTAGHATRGGTASTVEFHHDGVGNTLQLLLAILVLLLGSLLRLIEPSDDLVNLGLESLLVGGVKLLIDLGVGESVAQGVGIRLKAVLGSDTGTLSLILLLELLGLSKHALNVLLGETTLVVGDDNLVGLASALLKGRDVHDSVGIKIEGNLNLGNTTGSGGNASKLELAEQVVVLGALALTLVDLDKHTRLVVGEGREDLRLLGGNGGVAGNELGHHTTSGLDTEGQRGNIEKQDLVGGLGGSVTGENGGLDGGTIGNSLIGVDRLVGFLAIEVIGDKLLDAGNTGGATDKDDLVDLGLVDLGIGKDAVDGLEGRAEKILAQLLEAGTGDGGVEIDTLVERVDLNGGLCAGGEGTLGTLAGRAETAQGTGVAGKIP